MAEPEATPVEVQADPRQAAIQAAEQQLGRSLGGDPIGAREPEAEPVSGTGPEGGVEPPTEPLPTEVDWSNPEARDAELQRREESAQALVEERLRQQRMSMQGQLDLAEQAKKAQERQALLTELDALKAEDPEEYIRRTESDPEAAQAVTERANDISPAVIERAQMLLATRQAQQLFEVLPDLEGHATAGDEEWGKVINPETGGMFGYLKSRFAEDGATAFKGSKEYKDAIEAAETRGARNALAGVGEPPGGPELNGNAPEPRQQFPDRAQQAVADAMRAHPQAGFDVSRVRTRRSGART